MVGFRYLPGVVTLRLDEEKCGGCGMCMMVCPHGVFEMVDGKALITDRDACMECGACARNCATEALSVHAGVGCAAVLITGALRGSGSTRCCSADCSCGE